MKFVFALLVLALPTLCIDGCSTGGNGNGSTDVTGADDGRGEVADDVTVPDSRTGERETVADATHRDTADDRETDETGSTDVWIAAREFAVVVVDPGTPAPVQLAVQACAGLYNREVGGSVYIQQDANDEQWLDELDLEPKSSIDAIDFLEECLEKFPACVRYSYVDQRKLVPNILTVAAALEAVPLDIGQDLPCVDAAFDATVMFQERNTPYLATKYVFENFVEQTTGLAMLNPGYNTHDENLTDPELTRDMPSAMVDLVFSRKLFTVFLVNGCKDLHPERELLHEIVNAGHWPTPVGVYGYNNSWMVMGGYVHEAQTLCLDSYNMGAIPTETGNLSFFSTRRGPILEAKELQGNALEDIEYDETKTYVAFVIGDGDNIQFIMSTRKHWLRQRLSDCEKTDHSCAPVTWSISPHLPHLAPDVLQWYYKSARSTGRDYFTLPPSGHLYAYPTSLNAKDQDRFVTATEQDARLLGISSTVHWDFTGTWEDAEQHFLPKYARANGAIRGVFPINVPYMLPTFPWWPADQFFKVLTGEDGTEVVVFLPRQWRGVHNDSDPFFLSPQKMAEELGNYPPGTVTWVYMTSDGGLTLDNSFSMLARILPAHVQLVSTDTAARLALEAGARGR